MNRTRWIIDLEPILRFFEYCNKSCSTETTRSPSCLFKTRGNTAALRVQSAPSRPVYTKHSTGLGVEMVRQPPKNPKKNLSVTRMLSPSPIRFSCRSDRLAVLNEFSLLKDGEPP